MNVADYTIAFRHLQVSRGTLPGRLNSFRDRSIIVLIGKNAYAAFFIKSGREFLP